MALIFSGEEGSTDQFEKLLEAFDGDKRVIVVTSTEAIEDFGMDAIRDKADEKYLRGELDRNGRVWVLTVDLD